MWFKGTHNKSKRQGTKNNVVHRCHVHSSSVSKILHQFICKSLAPHVHDAINNSKPLNQCGSNNRGVIMLLWFLGTDVSDWLFSPVMHCNMAVLVSELQSYMGNFIYLLIYSFFIILLFVHFLVSLVICSWTFCITAWV